MSRHHARRGMGLESMLEGYHYRLIETGRLCMWKTNIPTFVDGKGNLRRAKSGHLPDYVGVRYGLPVAFDAKVTKEPAWPFANLYGKNKSTHQAKALDAFYGSGGYAFLYVRFPGRKDYLVRWEDLSPIWWAWHDLTRRARPGEASLSQDDAARLGWRVGDGGWADIDFERVAGGHEGMTA